MVKSFKPLRICHIIYKTMFVWFMIYRRTEPISIKISEIVLKDTTKVYTVEITSDKCRRTRFLFCCLLHTMYTTILSNRY